jgi:hypothetical protein
MARRCVLILVLLTLLASPVLCCTLCPNPANIATFRQEASAARMVLYGDVVSSKFIAGAPGGGTSELRIETALKADPYLAGKTSVTIPRFVPADPKSPPRYLIFCDISGGKLYADRGIQAKTPAVRDYVQGAMKLDPKDPVARLLYFFKYLDHAEPELAGDAYLEFAKATDQEVGAAAPKLAPERLRQLIQAPTTPATANRRGLYAFLLGACGSNEDAIFLRGLILSPPENGPPALDGVLAGYIQLRPKEGWALAQSILRDPRKSFSDRSSVLTMLRFFHNADPVKYRPELLRCLAVLLEQGDIADLAIEELRKWKLWDLTPDVLAQFGKKTHDAPIMRRAIVRYALCCPQADAERFLAARKKAEPELVKDVEESLQFEKMK